MKYSIIFEKIENNHNALRDNVIKGESNRLPEEGKGFLFFGPGRDIVGAVRMVNTSMVEEILTNQNQTITFRTKSGSIYSVSYTENA